MVTTHIPEQESVSLETTKIAVIPVIPELALVQEGNMITPILVATKQRTLEIMGTSTLKPWDTSWSSDIRNLYIVLLVEGKLHINEMSLTKKSGKRVVKL